VSPATGYNILATDTAGQACSVTYMYGAAQAMALASAASKTPFDPRSLDLPSIGALVGFYHACLGFPVKQTWLDAIKAGNCDTFEGLTYSNAAKYCPDADETIMGHLAQQRQNVRSTKPKQPSAIPLVVLPPPAPTASNHVVVVTQPLSKLFTDDTGRFPVRARSGNQYVMIAFHADGNLILQQAFKTKSDRHRIAAYNSIMTRLAARGLSVDLQILDNEASAAYKDAITFKWNATFQLVPPDMHRRNRAERAIRTFKDHFLAILAGVDAAFPPYLWDLLLPQAELTLNLLRQSTLNPRISAWEFFQGPFDFNKSLWVQLVVGSSSMPNRQPDALGIFVPRMDFTMVLPWIPTAASSWSMLTPKAKSSPTRWNSAIPSFPSRPRLPKTESFTAFRPSPVP
jgi:hypothetical protein